MRQALLAALLFFIAGSALADFADGQRRFSVGDHAGAYAAWLPLAESGDPRAQYSVGIIHHKGLGRPKDSAGAADWFGRAARQGYQPATAALKSMGKPAPGTWAKPTTDRDRVEHALRSMFTQPNGQAVTSAFRVTQAGDGFDVQVEAFEVPGDAGSTMRVPQLTARATRAAADAWRFDFRTPSAVDGVRGPGEAYRIRIDDGRTVLVWNETLEMTTNVDFDWRGLVFEAKDGPPLRLARLIARSDLEQLGGDRWGGPSEVRLEGMEIVDPGKARVKLAGLFVRAALGGADLARLSRLMRQDQGGEALDSLAGLRGLFSDASVEFGVNGLDAELPDGRFRLGDGAWKISLAKLDQPEFDLAIGYRHGGLSSERTMPGAELAPEEAQLKVALLRAPMEPLLQAGVAAGVEYMLTGQISSAPAIAETLRKALPAAGTQLRLEEGLVRLAKSRISLAGALAADAAAALGVAGALGVGVVGLEELPISAEARPILAEYGQTAADGSTVFKFELGRDGQALVNGKPLAPLLGALLSP